MFTCDHDYCPHLHYKKCLNARIQTIPYTIFPDGTIDSFTNVPMRCAKLYKSNIPTVAYQNFTLANGKVEDDRNFVRDYYLTKNKQCNNMGNTIVQQQQENMCKNSAYLLAGIQAQKYAQYEKKKQNNLQNARRRAISRYNDHFRDKQRQKHQEDQQNGKWLKKLYRKLQQVARHIIQGQGENASEREKQFLLSKTNLNAAYLSQIKVRNPKTAAQMLEEIRILMLKKKLRFQEQRQQQQHNKSVSMSFASQSGITNTSQNSMMSEATSLNESNIFGQDQVVGKYCDFQELKKKWKAEDIEQVKQILRRVLTKKIVSQAELEAVKKRKQAAKNDETIKKRLQKQGKSTAFSKNKNKKSKQAASVQKNRQSTIMQKNQLTKKQLETKASLLKGGQFDAIGQKFQRNRNYSQMFRSRQQSNTVQFTFKDRILSFQEDCCCSTQA